MTRARALSSFVVFLGLLACTSERFEREDEIVRFNSTVEQRTAALALRPDRMLTLKECEDIALRNNLVYRTTLLEAQLDDDQVRVAFAAMLPRANAQLSIQARSEEPQIQGSNDQFAFQDQEMHWFSLSAILPVFDFGATWFAYQIAEDERMQTRLAAVRARQTLLRDVRTSFARLVGALENEELLGAEVTAAEAELKSARALEREGLAAPADTSFVDAAVARSELDLTNARRDVTLARAVLARALSVPISAEFQIAPDQGPPPRMPRSLDDVRAYEQAALRMRPEPRSQDYARNIAAARVKRAFAELFPRLDATLGFDWSSNSLLVHPSFFSAGAVLGHALLDGSASIHRLHGAEAEAGVEEERALLVSMAVVYEVDLRLLELVRAHDGMAAGERLVEAQDRLLKQIRGSHREGLTSGADLARALADLHAARRTLNRTRTEWQVAWHELRAATAVDAEALPDDEAERVAPPPTLALGSSDSRGAQSERRSP